MTPTRRSARARPIDSPVEVLKDASAGAGGWAKVKTDLIRHFPGANDDARERAMADYLAARFDFIYRARETAANKERLAGQCLGRSPPTMSRASA